MKTKFEEWMDLNRQDIIDFVCEGFYVDEDLLTFFEKKLKQSFEDGFESGRDVEAAYWNP